MRTTEDAWFGTRAARDGRCEWRNRDWEACRFVSLGGRFESGVNGRGVRLVPGSFETENDDIGEIGRRDEHC